MPDDTPKDVEKGPQKAKTLNEAHFTKHPQVGVASNRKCRDIFCLLLFTLFWGGMFIILAFAIEQGDLSKVEYGDDYRGNTCGTNNTLNALIPANYSMDFTDKPYLYVPSPFEITTNLAALKRICVSSCPNETSLRLSDLRCLYGETPALNKLFVSCWPPYASTPVFNRCVPDIVRNTTLDLLDEINSSDIVQGLITDISLSWRIIVVCMASSLVIGWLWLLLMRWFAGIMVWFTIFTGIFLLGGFTAMMWYTGTNLQTTYINTPPAQQVESLRILWQAILYTSYVLAAICAIIIIITLFNCGRIHLAVTVCQEAGKAIQSMYFQLIFFPLVPFISAIAAGAFWIVTTVLIVTAATPAYDENGEYLGLEANAQLKGMIIYLLFGFLWTLNFVMGVYDVTVAGAIADWYWSFHGKEMKPMGVLRSFGRVIRYNLGSVIFGALLIAIVQLIRIMLQYLKDRLKGAENRVARCLITCLQCCMACFQRFLEFINKNAYVMIAVYGYSFLTGARRGLALVAANPLRVATLMSISKLMLFLGKVFITFTTLAIAFLWLKNTEGLRYYYFPLLFIGIVAWVVASAVMSIYDMAMHTMLFCFIEDTDRHDGSPEKPYRMPTSLKAFVDSVPSGCCAGCC